MATSTRPNVVKEQYKDLDRDIDSLTNGQGSVDENNCLENIFVNFYIREGIYRGATIEFVIKPDRYGFPFDPPDIICITRIYHPDIRFTDDYEDDDGSVYLSLVNRDWNERCTLKNIAEQLLFLIMNPKVDRAYNGLFRYAGKEKFEEKVRLSLRGERVDGVSFPRNLPDDYESDVEEEEDEDTVASTDNVLSEESVEPVATKHVEQRESIPEDVSVPAQNPTAN